MLWLHKAGRRIKDQEPRQYTFTRLVKISFSKLLSSESKLLEHSVSLPLCSCLQHDVPCCTVAFPCQHNFKAESRPRGLDVHVNGESHFYSNWRYLGSTTTSGFNARGASQKFPGKFSAESSQPALNPGQSTVVCTVLAPWDQHSWPAPFQTEQPT